MITSKIKTIEMTTDEIFDSIRWDLKHKSYWKEIFKVLDKIWNGYEVSLISDNMKDHPLLKKVKFVPFYKNDELYLNKACNINDYIRRIRYIKRGNKIPEYDKSKKFETYFKNNGIYDWNSYTLKEIVDK